MGTCMYVCMYTCIYNFEREKAFIYWVILKLIKKENDRQTGAV